jgi:ribosomal protein S20
MANLKSSKKDIRRTVKNTAINRSAKTRVRNMLKKSITLIESITSNDTFQAAMLSIVKFESIAMKNAINGKKKVSKKVSALVHKARQKFSNKTA